MPDDPAFLRMIAAAPADDAPRLVYADVLEESGDPAGVARAEFIRVQCERARLVPDSPRWRELWWRDTALLDWARQWRAELPKVPGIMYGGFIRGFIEQLTVLGDASAPPFGLLFERLPLRKVSLGNVSVRTFKSLVRTPELVDLEELELPGVSWLSAGMVEALTARGPWPRLRRLWAPGLQQTLYPGPREAGNDWEVLQAMFGDRLTR
jgi:uncharacterized protein (TIGR02996 family)